MGVYPRTPQGALRLLEQSARLAVRTGAARLIVKTTAEAHRIPTVAENVDRAARRRRRGGRRAPARRRRAAARDAGSYAEARALVEAVLDLDGGPRPGAGHRVPPRPTWTCPYCLHPDNAGRARSHLDGDGPAALGRASARCRSDTSYGPAEPAG